MVDERAREAAAMKAAGKRVREIAGHFGVTWPVVYRWLDKGRIAELEAALRQIAHGSYSTFKIETPEANAFAQICDEMQRIAREALK